jgi:hypothetical protein
VPERLPSDAIPETGISSGLSDMVLLDDVMLTRRPRAPLVDPAAGAQPIGSIGPRSVIGEKIASFARVRDVSRLGAWCGHADAFTVDQIERNRPCRVRSEHELGRKSSKRVQCGEPNFSNTYTPFSPREFSPIRKLWGLLWGCCFTDQALSQNRLSADFRQSKDPWHD